MLILLFNFKRSWSMMLTFWGSSSRIQQMCKIDWRIVSKGSYMLWTVETIFSLKILIETFNFVCIWCGWIFILWLFNTNFIIFAMQRKKLKFLVFFLRKPTSKATLNELNLFRLSSAITIECSSSHQATHSCDNETINSFHYKNRNNQNDIRSKR